MDYLKKLNADLEVYSLRAIARKLKRSPETVRQWAAAERIPSGSSLQAMADHWGGEIVIKPKLKTDLEI